MMEPGAFRAHPMEGSMRIRVDFTIEVDPAHLDRLRELSGDESATLAEMRAFVLAEAEQYLLGYLEQAGNVRVRSLRGSMGEQQYAW
jgi:hypothetical protein